MSRSVVVLLLFAACTHLPAPHAPGKHQPPVSAGREAKSRVAWKVVTAKQAPSELLANDGTHCLVSDETFEKAQVGDRKLCAWTL